MTVKWTKDVKYFLLIVVVSILASPMFLYSQDTNLKAKAGQNQITTQKNLSKAKNPPNAAKNNAQIINTRLLILKREKYLIQC